MKKLGKILSVGLCLAMCASMVTPAFAARVLTNDEIEWTGTLITEEGHWQGQWQGYHGTLKGYEEEGETKYDYYLADDLELDGTLAIGKDKDGNPINASLDLNGHELALNKGLIPDDVEFYYTDGNYMTDNVEKRGAVIVVEDGATLDLYGNKEVRDEDGELADKGYDYGVDENGDLTEGSVTGGTSATGWGTSSWNANGGYNDWGGFGGGILVRHGGTLNMTGGRVENNVTPGHGGGLATWNGTINLDGVTVSGNNSRAHGAGLAVYGGGSASIKNCVFEDNTANGQAVIMISNGTLSEFSNNIIKNNTHRWQTVMIGDQGLGHGPSNPEGNALCGNTEGWTGEATNNYYGISSEKPGHVWEDVAVDEAPTCTESGKGHWVCKSGCEGEEVVLPTDPDNHSGHGEYSEITRAPQIGVPGERSFYCDGCGALLRTEPIPALTSENPGGSTPTPDGSTSTGDTTPATEPEADATIGIEDEAVPLAGLFTRADAIGYLWEQAGSPEAELSDFPDVPEEHYWAVAIGWAQDMGIALPDEDGNFRPDDLVLRGVEDLEVDPEGELEEFLNRYAVFAGVELEDGELFIELDGAADDVIMGEEAQEIFNLFFALLEDALADQAA